MKKSILIFCIVFTAVGLMAIGYLNNHGISEKETGCRSTGNLVDLAIANIKVSNDINLLYSVGHRWSKMTRQELLHARNVMDIIEDDGHYDRSDFRNVRIDVLDNLKDIRDVSTFAIGHSKSFNSQQLALIQSLEYSTHLRVSALNLRTSPRTGWSEQDSILRYLVITPENEAICQGGFEAIEKYVEENVKHEVAIIESDKLQPGKVYFTVTKSGTVTKVKAVETSGYPSVDKALEKVIARMPFKWTPASNHLGVPVDQELVFFFGTAGC